MSFPLLRRRAGAVFAAVILLWLLLPRAAHADTSEDWFTKILEEYQKTAGDDPLPAPSAVPAQTAVPPSFGSKDPVKAEVGGRVLAEGMLLSEDGFEFVVSAREGYAVLTGYTGSAATVTVPASLGGYTVAYIGDGAFAYQSGITALTLPGTVTRLGHGVFMACVSLEEVSLPAGIADVGVNLFTYCKALKSVTLPQEIPVIRLGMFQQCGGLEKIVIPDRVTRIDELAFHSCLSLREVSVPASVKAIAVDAFSNCPVVTMMVYEGSYAQAYALEKGIPSVIIR